MGAQAYFQEVGVRFRTGAWHLLLKINGCLCTRGTRPNGGPVLFLSAAKPKVPRYFLSMSQINPFQSYYYWFFNPRSILLHLSRDLGVKWHIKKAKLFKELTFLGFVRYFSAKIEQSSKMSKTELKNTHLGCFFKLYSILAEK